jgi:hypothetical protein
MAEIVSFAPRSQPAQDESRDWLVFALARLGVKPRGVQMVRLSELPEFFIDWRDFHLVGTQSFNLDDHIVVAGRRQEDVEAQCACREHLCAAGALLVRLRGLGNRSRLSSFRKRGWTASGFTACCRMKGSKAMSSIRPRLQPHVGAGERRLTESTARRCTLLAYKRGEPRVCAMVKVPTPEEEDRRRLCRERKVPIAERVKHVNRIKGLLFSQGVSGYEPLRRDRRRRLNELRTGDGRPLPQHLSADFQDKATSSSIA